LSRKNSGQRSHGALLTLGSFAKSTVIIAARQLSIVGREMKTEPADNATEEIDSVFLRPAHLFTDGLPASMSIVTAANRDAKQRGRLLSRPR
jgi:hypothetical protein